jgi:hypothetical protein
MSVGGWIKGAVGAVTNSLGLTGTRDNKQGAANVHAYQNTLQNGQNDYNASLGQFSNDSNNLANQNFMSGAQNSFAQQQQNYGQQQDAYKAQQGASQMLYNQATGQTPSVADLQMQQGLGNANNQVQSTMLSQQGGVNPGLSQRNMLNAQAAQNASIVGQGQVARAGEINQAQQMYNQALAGISGQANAMGQTAANMTNQQQALGQFQYDQGQNNLNYQTGIAGNKQQVNATNAQNVLAGQQGNLGAAAQSNAAQAAAMGQTMKSVGGMLIPGK